MDEPTDSALTEFLTAAAASAVTLHGRRRVLTATYTLLITGNTLVGTAAAPPSGGNGGAGSEICGTAIAQTVNQTVPLVLAVTVLGGLILGYLLHAYSGFKKDPQKVKEVRDWRNRSTVTALSALLLGKLLEIIIGFPGLNLAQCIEIVPGI